MSTADPSGLLVRIVGFALRRRGMVLALAVLASAYGIYRYTQAKYDVFPDFAPPVINIQVEAPGLAPEQVETLVTQPVENAINGVPGIDTLRSNSIQGLSVITIIFDPKSDIYRDRQAIGERLAAMTGQLPQGVQPPVMTPLTSSTSVVRVVGLTSERRSLMELRTIADWDLRPRLLAVPGVAKVAVFGGDVKQFQVQVQPDKLVRYGLTLGEVIDAARRASGVRGAGFVDTPGQRIVLQTQGQSLTAEALARAPLIRGSGVGVSLAVRLGDVAHVAEAPEPPIGAASVQDRPGVQLMISDQYGANTLEVTRRIEQALDELAPALAAQGVTLDRTLFRPANFIETAVGNVKQSLLVGAGLVVAVLFAFLFDVRTAAISLAAIPLSLLGGVVALENLGYSLNTMTLGGLAIAIGLLVDDAVIVVENIFRRLRENRAAAVRRPAVAVALDAALEVRSAVVYATLVIALVFLPVLTLPGVAGRLFAPLATAYILATLASLGVAVTVTPALCLVLMRETPLAEPPLVRWLQPRYRALLEVVNPQMRWIAAAVVVLASATAATLPFLESEFIPELREGHFIVHTSAAPGTSLAESLRIGAKVTAALRALPYVRSVGQRVGRAEKADDTWGTHYSEFEVDLKPLSGAQAASAQADIREALARFPDLHVAVETFLTERMEEVLSGYTASVIVNVYGTDLDALDSQAQAIAHALKGVSGATEVQVQSPPGMPQLNVRLRPEAIARYGFEPVDVLDVVNAAYEGASAGQVYDGNRVFGITVVLDPALRASADQVAALPLRAPAGTYVRLGDLAEIVQTTGRYGVLHQGARRVQTVTADVAGRNVASFVAEARERIRAEVKLPPGTDVEFSGAAEAGQKATHDLLVRSILAGVAILIFLSLTFSHARNLALVLVNLPFALVGGVLAVFATGAELSIGSLVGFVTLFGITLRNSMMMIAHYEHLVAVEGLHWGPGTAWRGAQERLAPILMTALVTALGLLPLALGSGDPGREIEGPMATVILGGLATSTLLNLLVLPAMALRYGVFRPAEDAA